MNLGGETPSISNYSNTSQLYQGLPVGNAAFISNNVTGAAMPSDGFWSAQGFDPGDAAAALDALIAETGVKPPKLKHMLYRQTAAERSGPISPTYQPKETIVGRRIVQVYIADPNENVPLEDSILYTGPQKMTDLTDQELFFEIDIKNLLEAHNTKRVKLVDKKVKERVEHLEPIKVRDLKMVVCTVAQF